MADDVERHPGPALAATRSTRPEIKIKALSLNCRGLREHKKLKLILNNTHKIMRLTNIAMVLLQETLITNDSTLNLSWRGNWSSHQEQGTGEGVQH